MTDAVKFSQFGAEEQSTKQCNKCKLYTSDRHFHSETGFCKGCFQTAVMNKLNDTIGRYSMYFLLLGLVFVFMREFRTLGFIFFGLAILPMILFSTFQLRIIYYGIEGKDRIIHQIRFFDKLTDAKFYYAAMDEFRKHKEEISEVYREMIIEELVNSVVLSTSFVPNKFMENWTELLDMDNSTFVEYMINKTEILSGIGFESGSGLLPEIWPHISDLAIKEKILDILAETCEVLNTAKPRERDIFMDDLYLMEEELREIIGENGKWQIILEKIDAYEPETPPKNMLEAMQRQAQAAQKEQLFRQQEAERLANKASEE